MKIPAYMSTVALCASLVWSSASQAAENTLEKIKADGVIVIANNLVSPPWQFRDSNNQAAGFSIDLDRMLAKDLNVSLVTIDMDWAGLIPALLTRKSDILATSMSITPERAKRIKFTDEPWYTTGVVAYIGPNGKETSWDQLNQSGKRVAAKAGTTGVDTARKFFPKAEILSYPSDVDAFMAVKTGRADFVLNDGDTKAWAESYGLRTMTQPSELITQDPWAFATRLNDQATWQYLNDFLIKIKQDGRYDVLKDYWLGENWKKDYLQPGNNLSEQRRKLIDQLGIQDYVPEAGSKSRASIQ